MAYPDPNSKSAALYRRACSVMPGGNTRNQSFIPPHHLYADRAAGCRIWDVDGVERVDFVNNYTVTILGHGHPDVVRALERQVSRLVSTALPTEFEIELAETICRRGPHLEKVRFANTGTEAVMHAIKAARAYTDRPRIVKCEGAYHGSYDYAEVSLDSNPQNWGQDAPNTVPFSRGVPKGILDDMIIIPFNDPDTAERILSRHDDDVAAVLLDLAPSRCGGIPASPAFLKVIDDFRKRTRALVIADEVVSFRMRRGGAQEMLGFRADLTTLGKIVGGGMPVGAIAGSAEVMQVFDSTKGKALVPQSGTFTANPLSMIAGIKTLQIFDGSAIDRLNALGETARNQLREAIRLADVPGQVNGEASLVLVTFSEEPILNYRSIYRGTDNLHQRLMRALFYGLLNRGIFFSSWGLASLSTPMEQAEIDRLSQAVLETLREARDEVLMKASA
ncbi:MAG: aspartate aminotransferase family protein [Alphaproteobacteria bacterium]|nr:MAG: aspartate aminotransferase family protein [Alphaproteobacteria bacterium]